MTVVLDNSEWFKRCDFCSEVPTEELKHYEPLQRVAEVRVGNVAAEVEDVGPWCACKTCAELIDSDRWKELAERALVPLRAIAGSEVNDEFHIQAVRSMWSLVFGKRMNL